jgi:hypothetical protein
VSSVDPRDIRVAALRTDVEAAGENLSMIIAEAMALGFQVPHTLRDAVAALDWWAIDLRRT